MPGLFGVEVCDKSSLPGLRSRPGACYLFARRNATRLGTITLSVNRFEAFHKFCCYMRAVLVAFVYGNLCFERVFALRGHKLRGNDVFIFESCLKNELRRSIVSGLIVSNFEIIQ